MDYSYELRPSGDLPFINLIEYFLKNCPERYFLEPELISNEMALNDLKLIRRPQKEAKALRKSPKFGFLSRYYQKNYPAHGLHKWVFSRRDRGTIDRGLARTNEELYECAKFNVIRRPRENSSNNPNYDTDSIELTSDLDRKMIRLAAHYPRMADAVMSGPLLPRCMPFEEVGPNGEVQTRAVGQFSIPKKQQHSALARVFETPELCMKIVNKIAHRWEDLSNLSRTCHTILYAIDSVSTHVDIVHGDMLNMNIPGHVLEETKDTYGFTIQHPVSDFLIVSGVRGQFIGDSRKETPVNEYGYPNPPKGRYRKPTYRGIVENTFRFMEMLLVRAKYVKILHIHCVPTIDTQMAREILKALPNLEVLGIYNCELLHFGTTTSLQNMMQWYNDTSGKAPVKFDFYPFYYTGNQRDASGKRGEYGVMPSDIGNINTRMGMVANLRIIVCNALDQDGSVDWFTPGTAMRLYLDRLPWALGSLRYILEALYNLYDVDLGIFDNPHYVGQWRGFLKRTLWNDLVVAIHGRGMDRKKLDYLLEGPSVWSGPRDDYFDLQSCDACAESYPPCFMNPLDDRFCYGCGIDQNLGNQVENFYREKKEVADKLLLEGQHSIYDILNGKRRVDDEEVGDVNFPFWKLSVKTKQEVLDACNGDTASLILDGRPGDRLPEEFREIWLWKESLVRASSYAARHIDRGLSKGRKKIREYEEDRDKLLNDQRRGAHRNKERLRKTRAKVQELERKLETEKAHCGLAQMVDNSQQGPSLAAEWTAAIDEYARTIKEINRRNQGLEEEEGPWGVVWDFAFPKPF
ncbi:hypothetical protein F5B19DRAFT_493246 [Rostrohypoxylon terebratum]|nr:hypothetical protein F5B19DRAFT_493246 [Rostrohypoxylon terebratum]